MLKITSLEIKKSGAFKFRLLGTGFNDLFFDVVPQFNQSFDFDITSTLGSINNKIIQGNVTTNLITGTVNNKLILN